MHVPWIKRNSLHTDNNEGNNELFIGFNISAKFSYRVNNDNSKNVHLSADTDILVDILCIPKPWWIKVRISLKIKILLTPNFWAVCILKGYW